LLDASELCVWRAARDSNPNRQVRNLVLCVDPVGSRPICPAHVGGLVDPGRIQKEPVGSSG
jgi:hypothetical protein